MPPKLPRTPYPITPGETDKCAARSRRPELRRSIFGLRPIRRKSLSVSVALGQYIFDTHRMGATGAKRAPRRRPWRWLLILKLGGGSDERSPATSEDVSKSGRRTDGCRVCRAALAHYGRDDHHHVHLRRQRERPVCSDCISERRELIRVRVMHRGSVEASFLVGPRELTAALHAVWSSRVCNVIV